MDIYRGISVMAILVLGFNSGLHRSDLQSHLYCNGRNILGGVVPFLVLRCQDFVSSIWVWRFGLALKDYNICGFSFNRNWRMFIVAYNFKPMLGSSPIGLINIWQLVLNVQFWNILQLIEAFEFQIVWNTSFGLQK